MVYDSYRPGARPSAGRGRNAFSHDGVNDSMFWRRETPDERRGSRPADFTNPPREDGPQTRTDTIGSAGPRLESSTSRDELLRPSTSGNLDRPALLRRSSTTNALTKPISPPTSKSLPSHSPTITASTQLPNATRPRTAEEQQQPSIAKAVDPRRRVLPQLSTTMPETVFSPAPSSTDDGQDTYRQGTLVKDLINIIALRNHLKKEHEQLRLTADAQREELDSAQKMFPTGNQYSEKLREDVRMSEKLIQAKKNEIENLKNKEARLLRGLDLQNNDHGSMTTELQQVKANLAQTETDSKVLRQSNNELKQQVESLMTAVSTLKDQFAQQQADKKSTMSADQLDNIKEAMTKLTSANAKNAQAFERGITRITNVERDFKQFQSEDLKVMHADIKTHKLAMARLNDVFVTQEAAKLLADRLKSLEERPQPEPSKPQSTNGDYLQQTDLDKYVAIFNEFQATMEKQFQDVTSKQTPLSSELTNYITTADFKQHAYTTTSEVAAQSEKIKELESKLILQSNDFTKRLQDELTQYQNLQQNTTTQAENQRLVENLNALQTKTQFQDRLFNAHQHSIDSLSQRFNNITTDQLARQMAGMIEPMLTTIRPQVTAMQQQLREQHSSLLRFQAEQSATANKLENVDARVVSLSTNTGDIRKALAKYDVESAEAEKATQARAFTTDQQYREMRVDMQTVQGSVDEIQNRLETSDNASVKRLQDASSSLRQEFETQLADVQSNIEKLRSSTLESQSDTASLGVSIKNSTIAATQKHHELEQKYRELQTRLEELKPLVQEVSEIQQNLKTQQQASELSLNPTGESDNARLQAEIDSIKTNTALEFKNTSEEAHASLNSLVEQVQKARDEIDVRLTNVEKSLPNSQFRKQADVHHSEAQPRTTKDDQRSSAIGEPKSSKSAQGTPRVAHVTDSQRKNTLANTMNARSKPSQASPLARHFLPKVEADEGMGDTIDATPKPRPKPLNRIGSEHREVITIADSDQEPEVSGDDDSTQSPEPPKLDLSKWQKDAKTSKATPAQAQKVASTPTKAPTPQSKRKRESSNAGSSNGRASSDTRSGTPRSSGRERKKKKQIDD